MGPGWSIEQGFTHSARHGAAAQGADQVIADRIDTACSH